MPIKTGDERCRPFQRVRRRDPIIQGLHEARIAAGLSHAAHAVRAGVYQGWDAKASPRLDTLHNLAEACGMKLALVPIGKDGGDD